LRGSSLDEIVVSNRRPQMRVVSLSERRGTNRAASSSSGPASIIDRKRCPRCEVLRHDALVESPALDEGHSTDIRGDQLITARSIPPPL